MKKIIKFFLLFILLQFFIGCENDRNVNFPSEVVLGKTEDTISIPIEITEGKYCAFIFSNPVNYIDIYSINWFFDNIGLSNQPDSGTILHCSIGVGNFRNFYLDIETPVTWEDIRLVRSFVNKRGLKEIEGQPYNQQVRIPLRSGRFCSIGIQRPISYIDTYWIAWDFMINWTPMYLRTGTIYTYDYIGINYKKATLTIEHPVSKEDINQIRFFVLTNDWSKITPEIRKEPLM
ncbi:MAG TPA: hypothetical protein VFF33_01490 [Ignavibacteriaceae bacterium]|nr:hypothetical protein [Ignavibacteriaceae bacterium]